ncbi:ZIP family metal transporter [Variovorax robiniae]|uniref:ZIP family metal transporter n=1 Tax=Variovorax robiniae TaxID=1836199 RepID=UPI003BF4F1DC
MQAVGFTLIPLLALIIGAVATVWRRPGPGFTSGVQHFAAGVVFAAAASEILPDLKHGTSAWPILVGGIVGIVSMLAIKHFGAKAEGPVAIAAVTGIDIFIDGLVLGISFVAGARQGLLLTLALTVEVLFLGLTLASGFAETMKSRWKVVGLTSAIGLGLPLGALLGGPVGLLPAPLLTAFYAFGLIALLYLVTEELLVEAHEHPDTPLIASMFFVGFLALLMLEELLPQ